MTVLTTLEGAVAALRGPWLYLAVAALAAAECAAMIGVVVPGETAMLLGGVAVGLGQANLAGMVTVAISGAVVGDQIGFLLGRYLGRRVRHGRFARRLGEARWQRAEDLIARRGGPAVFIGRWVGVLRAAVPAVAGAVGMSRREFTVWNVAGAVPWAGAVILLGALAGHAWPGVRGWFGTAAWVGAGVTALVVLAWVGRHAVRRRTGRDLPVRDSHDGHIGRDEAA